MSSERFRYIPPSLAFILPLFMYARWPSYQWNVDGVACAAALELGNPVYLFHADHLIYGGLGYAFWKIVLRPIGVSSALPALQIMTLGLAAIGLAGVYALLTAQKALHRWSALALTLLIGASAVVWVWSVEAQVYAVGFAALAWATYALFEGKTPAARRAAGILSGVAILGHVMHVLWLVPAAYWIFQDRRFSRNENIRRFGMIFLYSAATAGAAYALVFNAVILPAKLSHVALMNWLKGSAGLTPDRHWAWHTQGWTAPLQWARASACFFWGSLWPYNHAPLPAWIWALTFLTAAAIGLLLLSGISSGKSPRRNFSILWIGMYALLLWTWEPSTLCYRMTEGIPLAILIGLGLSRVPARISRTFLIGSLFLGLALITWRTRIGPMNRPENNTLYMQTLDLARQTPEHSLYLTNGGVTWIYLLYFTHRTAWNVEPLPATKIEDAIASYKKEGAILLDKNVFDAPTPPVWIAAHRWKPLANLPWMELQ